MALINIRAVVISDAGVPVSGLPVDPSLVYAKANATRRTHPWAKATMAIYSLKIGATPSLPQNALTLVWESLGGGGG